MTKSVNCSTRTMIFTLLIVLTALPISAQAQKQNQQAIGLLGKAMDSYSNLDMDACKATLKQALDLATQIDRSVLARIYASYGVLWSGGYGDNGRGQNNFMIAICLDPKTAVDPLYLTPDIDTIFRLAKDKSDPGTCRDLLKTVTLPPSAQTPGPTPPPPPRPIKVLPPCGEHKPLGAQKLRHELPFYVKLHPAMKDRLDKLTVHYIFDSGKEQKLLPLRKLGKGYGAMLTCDKGEIRLFNPSKVAYYIEGQDEKGRPICSHGSGKLPLEVVLAEKINALTDIADMKPKECKPCPPWGCPKPGEGEECTPDPGCDKNLQCSTDGICVRDEARPAGLPGPDTFYVNLSAGSGAGYFSQEDYSVDRILETGSTAQIAKYNFKPKGFAWNGVPIRIAIGFNILPVLSLEVTARLDAYVSTIKEPKSCASANAEASACSTGVPRDPGGVALSSDNAYLYTENAQVAWITNIRARYHAVQFKNLVFSVFGGVGYGYIKYRIPVQNATGADEEDRGDTAYFPAAGMINIELGPALTYFFHDNVGVFLEIPIDILVGDGFALNFDFCLGFEFGF